ncbi:unnamed protein product [Brassica oleracea var. botrytis]|uniref:(rape) hypothetical protein n=1 Tax=Brassica napus TaxID=3708 RepID=A0A816IJX7_BRANA|nr:unnamed protein product [Brassica napus]
MPIRNHDLGDYISCLFFSVLFMGKNSDESIYRPVMIAVMIAFHYEHLRD